jgi:formylglycine-generating enzyme required for sulfatase activity
MVVVPAGSFVMGSPEFESGRDADEGPQHLVSVRAFAIGRTHVTRGEFARFVSATGYAAGSDCYYWTGRWLQDGGLEALQGASWQNPGHVQTDRDPVVCVSHADAEAYVRWLSARTGRAYRLPSESEFEYAARAGTLAVRWWGDAQDGACASANARDDTFAERFAGTTRTAENMFLCRDGYAATSPVGSFRPNPFGLYDMLGNAWQWTADCYHESYVGAPADGSAWTLGDCSSRVLRGGSWSDQPGEVRSACRYGYQPADRYDYVGFRVARALTP